MNIKPYEIREVIQFDLMFYDKYDNTQVISNSKLFAQNVCGSSTGTSNATSSRSTSQTLPKQKVKINLQLKKRPMN